MEIRDLNIYLSVFKHQSLSKAASENYITQPAVSRKISAMEEEYDKVFFHRSSRGVIPTEAGMEFAKYAEQFLELYENSQKDILRKKGSRDSHILSIAALMPATNWFLPDALVKWLELYPGSELILDYYTPNEMVENMRNDYYDLYITVEPDLAAVRDLHYLVLIKDKPALLTRKEDAPQTEEEAIRILKATPIYTISRITSTVFFDAFSRQLSLLGLKDPVIKEIPRVNSLKYYVLSNMGCVFLPPYLDAASDDPGLSLFRFRNGPEYNMGLGWKEETPAIRAFLDVLKHNFDLPVNHMNLSGPSFYPNTFPL
ncbi:MAG: LysR family transcriptional regulator [Parasporobacterium sp.]|nr:LysR family transcriptional regulator [Parasporobacterium sp.]